MTIFSTLRYSLLMALNRRLSVTISGLLRATPRSSNRALIASNLSSMVVFLLLAGRAFGAARGRKGKIKRFGMFFRKFKADYLFLGDRMAEPNSVLITTAEGRVQSIVPEVEAGEGVEQHRGVLSPGFVNCHCHLELSHLKGVIPEGTGLVDFLSMVIRRRGEGLERIPEAMLSGEEEMLQKGVVAVGDI